MRIVIFLVLFAVESRVFAAQDAIVVTEGAIVYQKANFDSAVLGYLRQGEQVRISDKVIGAFYRMRFKNQLGYISDVDVRVEGRPFPSPESAVEQSDDQFESDYEDHRAKSPGKSLVKAKHIGIMGIYTRHFDYITNLCNELDCTRNQINDETSTGVFFYGLKFNVPSSSFDRMIWDVNTVVSLQPVPQYSKHFAVLFEPQFLFFLDAIMKNNGFLFLGVGPVLSYWSLQHENLNEATSGFGFNIVASFHIGLRIKSIALKIEPRYYLLNAARYFAISVAIQKVF